MKVIEPRAILQNGILHIINTDRSGSENCPLVLSLALDRNLDVTTISKCLSTIDLNKKSLEF